MNILYIEDNMADATLVHRYINTTEHDVTIVTTVDDAYRALEVTEYDMVMVDIIINQQRIGYELAAELRAHNYDKPIIAITALITEENAEFCRQAGIDLILAKPFSITELADIIEHYD